MHQRDVITSVEVTVVVVEFAVATDDSDNRVVDVVTFSNDVDTFSEENANEVISVVVSEVVNVEVVLDADNSELADVAKDDSVETMEESDEVVDVEVESDDKIAEVEDTEVRDDVLSMAVDMVVEDDIDDSVSEETRGIV